MNEEEFNIENHLRDLRKRRSLSQEELARELGISRQSIISLEQGRSLPSLPLVFTLCNFFDSSFEDLFRFGEEMDRLLLESNTTPDIVARMPKIDIQDNPKKIIVKAELPGMTEEEVEIEILDNLITIAGEKREDGDYSHKESHTGAFSRSLSLPSDIDAEKAEAEMKNGVLTITIPKVAPKKATKIKVLRGDKPEKS